MALGSGLASQVIIGQETTVGTAVTPDTALEFTSESVVGQKNTLQGAGLHAGGQYNRAALRSISTVGAAGDLVLPYRFNKMGKLWRHSLGAASTPTTVGTGAVAYKTIFTPGGLQGLGLTYQKGVPRTSDGTVVPFTFFGGKVAAWKWSISVGALAEFTATLDCWNYTTATALTAASYAAGNNTWAWNNLSALKFGGTATTTSGVVSVASGVTATTLVNSIELSGTNPLKTDRQGVGYAGVKREQLENDYRTLQCTLGGEFTNETELFPLFTSDASFPVQFTLTGPQIATSGQNYTMDVILSACKINTDDVTVGGPDVVGQSPVLEVLDDGINAPIQVTLISTDSTV